MINQGRIGGSVLGVISYRLLVNTTGTVVAAPTIGASHSERHCINFLFGIPPSFEETFIVIVSGRNMRSFPGSLFVVPIECYKETG